MIREYNVLQRVCGSSALLSSDCGYSRIRSLIQVLPWSVAVLVLGACAVGVHDADSRSGIQTPLAIILYGQKLWRLHGIQLSPNGGYRKQS